MNRVAKIELFAGPREMIGQSTITVELSDPSVQVKDLLKAIASQHEPLAALIPSCRIAVDDRYVGGEQWITSESVLSLIPPVSGG